MCGLTVHMLNKLWPVMTLNGMNSLKNKLTVNKLKEIKITSEPHVFMYARRGCDNSRMAFNHIKTILKVKPEDFTIVDVRAYKYICAKSVWTESQIPKLVKPKVMASAENVQLNQLMGSWCMLEKWYNQKGKKLTKPQIFIHTGEHVWYYVGGWNQILEFKDPDALLPAASAGDVKLDVNEISDTSDLLHLLPRATSNKSIPTTPLKF